MSLLEQIRATSLVARKSKAQNSSFLVTLLGEAIRPGKDNGNRDSTNEEVLKVIKKFKAGLDETLKAFQDRGDSTGIERTQMELTTLEPFLPQLLTETELTNAISALVSGSPSPNIGQIMGALKKSYGDKYDGALASRLVKEALSHG